MKHLLWAMVTFSLLSGAATVAQPNGPGRNGPSQNQQRYNDQRGNGQDRYEEYRNNPGVRMSQPRFSRGDRLPPQYRNNRQYVVNDWQQRHLRKPPRGYHWVRDENDNYFLAAITTGLILDLLLNSR